MPLLRQRIEFDNTYDISRQDTTTTRREDLITWLSTFLGVQFIICKTSEQVETSRLKAVGHFCQDREEHCSRQSDDARPNGQELYRLRGTVGIIRFCCDGALCVVLRFIGCLVSPNIKIVLDSFSATEQTTTTRMGKELSPPFRVTYVSLFKLLFSTMTRCLSR